MNLDVWQWTALVVAALCVGVAKSGLGGVGMLAVLLMASVFPAKESTGIVLPLLISADIFAVFMFRKHAQWHFLPMLLPPAVLGIIAGFIMMPYLSDRIFPPVIGGTVLLMIALHYWRRLNPDGIQMLPHSLRFAWLMGGVAGVSSMLANAAGPVMTIYLLARRLPKKEFVGTAAVFFFAANLIKVPFSVRLGLINGNSMQFILVLIPVVLCGLFAGRWLLNIIPQKLFEELLLIFSLAAALRLVFTG